MDPAEAFDDSAQGYSEYQWYEVLDAEKDTQLYYGDAFLCQVEAVDGLDQGEVEHECGRGEHECVESLVVAARGFHLWVFLYVWVISVVGRRWF